MNEIYNAIKSNPQLGLKIISYEKDISSSLYKFINLKNSIFIFEKNLNKIPENNLLNLFKNKTEIIDVEKAYERYLFKIPVDYVSQDWIVENLNSDTNTFHRLTRRVFDIVISIIIFIVLSPFLFISALFIYAHDRGPILYKQQRVGLNGKEFTLYKLRSMIVDSLKNGIRFTEKNDNRITPIGKIIRKTHIDEIPQMINILKGEMSFVGPRPEWVELVKMFEKEIPHYGLRHIIRPGFTGWAQIKYQYANNIENSKEKFQYDLYYIKNRNIFLDFGIILKTIQIIFTH